MDKEIVIAGRVLAPTGIIESGVIRIIVNRNFDVRATMICGVLHEWTI